MVFFKGGGLIKVSEKAKIPEIDECATTFTCLGPFDSDLEEGVLLLYISDIDNLQYQKPITMVY